MPRWLRRRRLRSGGGTLLVVGEGGHAGGGEESEELFLVSLLVTTSCRLAPCGWSHGPMVPCGFIGGKVLWGMGKAWG